MISVKNLCKRYGSLVAVDQVSFTAAAGEVLGLLGPNGAGKTTILRTIYGVLKPSAGAVEVEGVDVVAEPLKAQRCMGILGDNSGLYRRLSARENIAYFGALHGMSSQAIEHAVTVLSERLHMQDIIDRPTRGFSQGERMKVNLARALVHNPSTILLDEPTNGLDVLTTRAVRELILQLKQEGKTIVLSSHLMYEMAQICDRLIIVAGGRIRACGTPAELQVQTGSGSLEDAFVKLAYGALS